MKYQYNAANILAIHETLVWADMASATKVKNSNKKTVTVKTTEHEKTCLSVCLAAKANDTKLPPFIVFMEAKGGTNALEKEIVF